MRKIKYLAIYLREVSGMYMVVSKRRMALNDTKVKLKNRVYEIDMNYPVYRDKDRVYYFFDHSGQISTQYRNETLRSNSVVDKILSEQIIDQLAKSTLSKFDLTNFLINVFLGLGIGLFVGFIVRGFM